MLSIKNYVILIYKQANDLEKSHSGANGTSGEISSF